MIVQAPELASGSKVVRPWRLRFGLKTLLVTFTILTVGFGYWAARRRAAAECISRHNAIVKQLVENLRTAPPNTTRNDFAAQSVRENGAFRRDSNGGADLDPDAILSHGSVN